MVKNFFTFVHSEDLLSFANTMIELMKSGKGMNNIIGPFRIKDNSGKFSLHMANLIPLENTNNEIVEIALTLRDAPIPM